MASIKISELEEVTELSTSDVLPIINENETKKVSIEKLSEILGGSGGGGTVDVDLSNYYTKDEVNVLVENNTPGAKTYIAKDVYSRTNASPDYITPASTGGKNILAAVQKAYNNGDYTLRLRMYANNPSLIPQYIDTVLTLPESGNGAITETTTRTYVFSNITATTLKYYYFSKNIKMTNGEVVAGSTSSVGSISYKEEKLVNTTTLNDYVKTTTVNTELARKQNTLIAGENITIDENNVISASSSSGGGGESSNVLYNIHLTSVEATQIISNPRTPLSITELEPFSTFINAVKDRESVLLYMTANFGVNHSTEELSYMYQGLLFRLIGSYRNDISSRENDIQFVSTEILSRNYLSNKGALLKSYKLRIVGNWVDDVFTASEVYLYTLTSNVLDSANTTVFTPTGDYNPATKKYVDDAITSAITSVLEAEY